MRFYFCRIHFLSGDVDDVRNPAHDLQRGIVSLKQIVRNKNTVAKLLVVGLGKIAVAHRRAANANLAGGLRWIDKLNFDTLHRLADKTALERCAVAIVANSAAFRCAVEGIDRLLEFLEKLFRDGAGERRTSRNAQPKFWERGHITNVAKRLVKSRRAGKNCRAGARKIS